MFVFQAKQKDGTPFPHLFEKSKKSSHVTLYFIVMLVVGLKWINGKNFIVIRTLLMQPDIKHFFIPQTKNAGRSQKESEGISETMFSTKYDQVSY